MTELTLKERLLRYLQNRPGVQVPSGELQRLTVERTSYTAQNAGRRLRELAEDGIIEVTYIKNHAYYTYNEPKGNRTIREIRIVGGRAVEIVTEVSV